VFARPRFSPCPDITARYLAQEFTETWKQRVIVDNRPGARVD
jgi:tripartite-type tricarboxylate transporter receptor subunit TctC